MRNLRKNISLMFRGLLRRCTIIVGGFCINVAVIQFKIFPPNCSLRTDRRPLTSKPLNSKSSWPRWKIHSSAKSAWTARLTLCSVPVDIWFHAVAVQPRSTCVPSAEGQLNVLSMCSSRSWLDSLTNEDTWTSASDILHSVVFKGVPQVNYKLQSLWSGSTEQRTALCFTIAGLACKKEFTPPGVRKWKTKYTRSWKARLLEGKVSTLKGE